MKIQAQGKHLKTIFIANFKGGVGKTTTAINLTMALSEHNLRTRYVSLEETTIEKKLADAIDEGEGLDYLLLDAPPFSHWFNPDLMTHIDYVLIPTTLSILSILEVRHTIELIESSNPNFSADLCRILFTNTHGSNQQATESALETLACHVDLVLRTEIPSDANAVWVGPRGRIPMFFHQRTSKAASAYRALAVELLSIWPCQQ